MYCPCKANGALSMYQQLLWTLGKLKWDICPKQAILDDLASEITVWQEAGDTMIVMADFNKDIHLDDLWSYFSKFGMSKVCSTLHSPLLPASHNQGMLPIDGIFAPDALIPMCRAGYLTFGNGVLSDHQVVWMDIPSALLEMCKDTYPVKASTCHLQCADPWVVLQYNTLLHEQLTKANTFIQAETLQKSLTRHRLTKAQQTEYEALDNISTNSKQFAECHCRKIKAGNIPWCLQVSHSINRILYWKGLLSKILGCKIGTLVLCTRAKKAGITHNSDSLAFSPKAIQNHIAATYQTFNRLRKELL